MNKPFIVANVREILDGWEHFDPEGYSFSKMVEMLNEVAEQFYKPKTDNMTQQTMTKEQILDRNGFDFDAFKYENEYSAKNLLSAMEEYAQQEVAKERENAKNLVEALDVIRRNTQDRLIYDIAKQSLSEYKK